MILIKKLKNFIITYIQIHCFISILSLPFLVGWGIPISLMSIIGNLLFSPLMFIFLSLSSLIFFSELCNIPNHYLIKVLEYTHSLITVPLGWGSKYWLFAAPKPSLIIVLAIIPLFTVFGLMHFFKTPFKRLSFMMSILCLSFFILNYNIEIPIFEIIPGTKSKMTLHYSNGQFSLNDEGFLNSKSSPEKYVNYILKPYLFTNYGNVSFDTIEIRKPSLRTLKGFASLCETVFVQNVVIHSKIKFTKAMWKFFFKIKNNINGTITTYK